MMAVLLAGLWGLELLDQLSGERLDSFGIHARELDGLPEIFSAPFLVLLGGLARWLISSLISIVSSGLAAWLLTPANTVILGASGLIFGWLTYLLARGLYSRRPGQVIVSLIVLLIYGSMIWGVLPNAAGVSWQAHLGGAVGGLIAARALHRRRTGRGPSGRVLRPTHPSQMGPSTAPRA